MQTRVAFDAGALEALCVSFGVTRLDAFGSALRPDFGPQSDLDLLVEFAPRSGMTAFEQYFGFKEAVEAIAGRSVDLVVARAIRNSAFQTEVDRTRSTLYVAA